MASGYYNGRLFESVSISSNANNTLLVFDKRREWQKWVGINADVMVVYNSKQLFGNQNGIWQMETGTSDNGNAISSYFTSRNYLPAGAAYKNLFHNLFMTTTNSQETLTTQYYVDGVNTPYSLASRVMNTVDGYQSFKLPFTDTSLSRGRMIQFKWTVSATTDWRILDGELYFTPETVIQDN